MVEKEKQNILSIVKRGRTGRMDMDVYMYAHLYVCSLLERLTGCGLASPTAAVSYCKAQGEALV